MNRNIKKKVITLLITIILIIMAQPNVFAGVIDEGWGWFLHDDAHMDINITLGQSGAERSSFEMTQRALGIVQLIGSIISIVALMIIGFRYMFSSLEEKAAMKGVIIYYVIGAVLVFATSNILSIVYNILWKL